MSLRNMIASDIASVFIKTTEFADPLTYIVDGDRTEITGAVIFDEQQVEEEFDSGRRLHVFRDVTISRNADDACGGIASPRTDATITIGEVVYAVESIPYQDDHTSTLRLVRKESLEHGRRNYRGI